MERDITIVTRRYTNEKMEENVGKLKRYVAVVIVLSMLLPISVNNITAEAKETNKKVYGSVNIESEKLLDEDIPYALV